MRLWGEKSGPCMQLLHAAFAVGAFIAPLIAKPFITDITDSQEHHNTSLVFNVSCTEDCNGSSNDSSSVECVCIDSISEACNTTRKGVINLYYDVYSNQSNCSVIEGETLSLQYGWAYWIAAMFLFVPLLPFVYFAVRYDLTQCFKTKVNRVQQEVDTGEVEDLLEESEETINDTDTTSKSEEFVEESNKSSSSESANLKTYKYPAFFLLFLFMLFYVGSEISYGSLLFTFAVKSRLSFDKQTAASVTAVFWGPFAFARLLSVVLALFKVRASVMMSLNVTGSVTAILILSVFPHNRIAVWITSALLGASFASIFPTAMTWMSEHLPVSGKGTAVLNAGGNIGDIAIPSAVAALIGNVHPDSFVYSVLSLIVLSTTVLILLFLMTAVYQRRHRPGGVTAAYNKLHQTITFGENGELNAGSIMEEVEPGDHIENTGIVMTIIHTLWVLFHWCS